MISSLRGTVLATSSEQVVVEVGGVGFSVAVPMDLARTVHSGQELRLHTQLVVREDALSLYGFADHEQREVFGLLLSVTGVGPRSALGIVAQLSVDQIATAVSAEDDAPFRRVSGIGPKTAKLIVMQLAGKLVAPVHSGVASAGAASTVDQLAAALVGLGWPQKVATDAAERTVQAADETERESVAQLLRLALASLGSPQVGVPRG